MLYGAKLANFSIILPKIEVALGFWVSSYSPLPDGQTVNTFNLDYRRDVYAGLFTPTFYGIGIQVPESIIIDHCVYPLPYLYKIARRLVIDILNEPKTRWDVSDVKATYTCLLYKTDSERHLRTLWRNSVTDESAYGELEVCFERALLIEFPKLATAIREFNRHGYTYTYSEIANHKVCDLPKARLVRRGLLSKLLNLI